ncbi:MAG: membrane protein insertion efficiency factor YidD [Desertifilum sp. SIO1I2]|nr:membrane protein insertion efficiency factor YidD [Desertifilum sp. SIO1I2]
MNGSWLDFAVRHTAASSIGGYQRYISPRKGFACAYRILHQDLSCSEYAKRAIAKHGLGDAIPLIHQRFQACKQANQTLKTRFAQVGDRPEDEENQTRPKKQPDRGVCALGSNDCQEPLCCEPTSSILECGAEGCGNESSCPNDGCGDCTPDLDCSGVDCCSCG